MDWTQVILDKFPRKAIYLIKDEDSILENEEMRLVLRENGIAVIDYSDPVHFRFVYESDYRNKFSGTLIIRLLECNFEKIPWDVHANSFKLTIGLNDIFPHLNREAVIEIDPQHWQQLFEIQTNSVKQMNYENTKRIIETIYSSIIEDKKRQPQVKINDEVDLSIFKKSKKIFSDWGLISQIIGKQRLLETSNTEFENLVNESNQEFQEFITNDFDKGQSMTAFKQPNYVNQIASFMERNVNRTGKRQALIVMDGMSFTQWALIERWLITKGILTKTNSTIAWIPSITSVSRQAIFSGKRPDEFEQSITTTAKETHHWKAFWKSHGFESTEVKYQRGLGHRTYQDEYLEFKYNQTKIYGCVIDVIDEFMHGARQGLVTVQSELNIWLNRGYLEAMLHELIDLNYDVYITSDHGNIEAVGIGQIQQGVLATGRGQRVRIYDDEVLRNSTHDFHKETTMKWNSSTLPKSYLPLIAREKNAFSIKNDIIMTHGGTHIEEVFIPFVTVLKKDEL
ncbi:BREX-3 system phosphatase PglZ [Latilactobacillus fuchuensis]|uniref:Uncharacterized protein n=1 Tax=Latilactobacillus fuchuensis TaxID=164393 RepID=A0A2N9DUZ7_9LACO|nr:BREX-3 system phosphatase PglZ [Latilactobacillus fuchuensis]SPC38241.1 conserved hypothetical protein [Latilactobacillus fuchuensis]